MTDQQQNNLNLDGALANLALAVVRTQTDIRDLQQSQQRLLAAMQQVQAASEKKNAEMTKAIESLRELLNPKTSVVENINEATN